MKKIIKFFLGLAAIGAAVAGIVYFINNRDNDDWDDDFADDFEDEDFDLDDDLDAVSDREYVSLNPTPAQEDAPAETAQETATTDTPEADTSKVNDTTEK